MSANLIVPVGTQIVVRKVLPGDDLSDTPGAVAEIMGCPSDAQQAYRVRLVDGSELSLRRHQFSILKHLKTGPILDSQAAHSEHDFDRYVIYRCVIGSQAYGLSRTDSDIDRRGIYIPPAELEWSIFGVPELTPNATVVFPDVPPTFRWGAEYEEDVTSLLSSAWRFSWTYRTN